MNKQKEKILALDFGQKRIGMAISEGKTVASLGVINVQRREEVISQIFEVVRREGIQRIILGIPFGQAKSEDFVRSFALELNKSISLPIVYEDETLTSKEAERVLKELKIDPRSKKYKEEIDRISAKLILEQFLKRTL